MGREREREGRWTIAWLSVSIISREYLFSQVATERTERARASNAERLSIRGTFVPDNGKALPKFRDRETLNEASDNVINNIIITFARSYRGILLDSGESKCSDAFGI